MDDIAKEDTGTIGSTKNDEVVVPPTTTETTITEMMDTTKEEEDSKVPPPETNDITTTTTTTTTPDVTTTVQDDDMKTDETKDEIKTDMDVAIEENNEEKKDEKEEKDVDEVIEEKEDQVTNEKVAAKSTESGKKKRKSRGIEGEITTTTTTTTTTSTNETTKRSGRDRKSVEIYDPKKYDKSDKTIQVIDGRGMALKSIPQCKEAIEIAAASTSSVDDIQMAFKFVFGSKYKLPSKKDMVQHLLDFNGYLPKKDTAVSKEEQEKIDDELEAKFGARAYKLTIQALKKVCDFFMVDRFHTTSKDGLVDKLLDFLGAPQKNKVKGKVTSSSSSNSTTKKSTTKKSKPTKRAKTDKKNDEDEEDEEEKDEEEEEEEQDDENANDDDDGYDDVDDDKLQQNGDGEELPTKDKLRKWVRAYVRCFHETKLTVNHALEIGSEKFGIDLLPMKADLKKLLIEEL